MFVKMVKGKKGAQMSFETIVAVLILAVLLGLVVLTLMGFFGDIGALFGFIPNDLPKKAEFCKQFGNDQASYCDFSLANVEGKGKIYVNCAYTGDSNFRESIDEVVSSPPICATNSEIEFCNQIRSGKNFKETAVNNLDCPKIEGTTCESLGGVWSTKACNQNNGQIDIKDIIEDKFEINHPLPYCCGQVPQ